jgi:hypothetical protein
MGARHRLIVSAMFKAGKTTLVTNMAKSYADETLLFGTIPCSRPDGQLAFWNLEMDRADWLEYVRPLGIGAKDRIRTAHLRGRAVPFMSSVPARRQAVAALTGASCWVLDTIGKVMAWHGIDPNDNGTVLKLCSCIDEIMDEAGVQALITSAHMPHAARESRDHERAIGAQSLSGWADSLLTLTVDSGDRFLSATGRQVALAESQLTLNGGILEMTGGSRSSAAETRIEFALVAEVRNHPGISFTALDSAVTGNQAMKRKIILKLSGDGRMKVEKGRGNISDKHWMID